jgi:hypothetical protein
MFTLTNRRKNVNVNVNVNVHVHVDHVLALTSLMVSTPLPERNKSNPVLPLSQDPLVAHSSSAYWAHSSSENSKELH